MTPSPQRSPASSPFSSSPPSFPSHPSRSLPHGPLASSNPGPAPLRLSSPALGPSHPSHVSPPPSPMSSAPSSALMSSFPPSDYSPLPSLISPPTWRVWSSNLRLLFSLAWPVSLSYLLQYGLGLVSLIFIGHISSEKLAAAALGNMYVNITGYAVGIGLASAVDTLCSQAYGAKSYLAMGLTAQRAGALMVLLAVPIFLLWYYCTELLVLLRQDPAISADAGRYVWRMAPSLIPYLWFEVMKKWLIAQRIMKPMIVVLTITNVIHVFLCWLYIYPMGWGFIGAPTATMTAQYLMLLLGLAVVRYKGYHYKTWPSLSINIFRGWGPLLRFGVPGALMLCLEWWSFEMCALVAGWLGAVQLDAFVVMLQVQSYIFMVPLGISIAISTITGNRLGAGQPQLAREGARVAVVAGLVPQLVMAVSLLASKGLVGRVFSSDPEVIGIVEEVLPIVCVMLMFDALQVVSGGTLRGIGFQHIGAVTNLASYYLVGLPLAALFVWQGWQVKGLVTGLMVAVFITAYVFVASVLRVDWVEQSRQAVQRSREERREMDEKATQLDARQEERRAESNGAGPTPSKEKARWYEEKEAEMAPANGDSAASYVSLAMGDAEERKEAPA